MHNLEPFFNWRDRYIATEDERSPFYGVEHSEFQYTNKVYNYFIHPQWDDIGSISLYLKVLFVDYKESYTIIELIGEWNDAVHNDIRTIMTELISSQLKEGIAKFILLGENVLNFHFSDDCYYEEWYEEVMDQDGWIMAVNFRDHVLDEMRSVGIDRYLFMGEPYNHSKWRTLQPKHFYLAMEQKIMRLLS